MARRRRNEPEPEDRRRTASEANSEAVPVYRPPSPMANAKRVLELGPHRARNMLLLARRHGWWKHVDWEFVKNQLPVLDKTGTP